MGLYRNVRLVSPSMTVDRTDVGTAATAAILDEALGATNRRFKDAVRYPSLWERVPRQIRGTGATIAE